MSWPKRTDPGRHLELFAERGDPVTTLQTEWSEEELLASHRYVEPLVVDGMRFHGGFDESGTYRSPRTLNRPAAIAAWQAQRAEQFSTPLIEIDLATWPENYPNQAQARYLLSEGVPEPIVATLTRIGTVEGFGSLIRNAGIPGIGDHFVEDVRGTAIAHLDRGLFEAHARDEAGFEDEGGHRQMWFAARDIAFEHPVTEDQTELMLARMGITGYGSAPSPDPAEIRRRQREGRLLDDVDLDLEMLITRMARLLLIEISAFHIFAWAEELLSDSGLVAGEGSAARIVSWIRSDETCHVEYLKTVLSEMRDRTFIGESGRRHRGTEVVGRILDSARADSLGPNRAANLSSTLAEVERALDGRRQGSDILERFHQVGSIRPGPDGHWQATS